MAIVFYPNIGEIIAGTFEEKLATLMQAAERYKTAILNSDAGSTRYALPRDISIAVNWNELAQVLHDIRDLSETTQSIKIRKATYLTKLAEVYEILRTAKMPKLEAVRIALLNEAKQLRQTGSSRVA